MNRTGLLITGVALIVGGVIGYLAHPKTEQIEIDVTKYEYENEIQRLQYEAKIAKIESEYFQRLHFIEDADSTQLDSLWIGFGF